ncbi:hypothetical protein ACXYUI_27800, partial [Klebsiella pneumoniae]
AHNLEFHHKTPSGVQQKLGNNMSYIRHKILIDSSLSQAYTREQPEEPQGRQEAMYRPVDDNENRSHQDHSDAVVFCRQNTSLTGF